MKDWIRAHVYTQGVWYAFDDENAPHMTLTFSSSKIPGAGDTELKILFKNHGEVEELLETVKEMYHESLSIFEGK